MTSTRPLGLSQRYCQELEVRHYARHTVKIYEQWLRRFLRFHCPRPQRQMGSTQDLDFDRGELTDAEWQGGKDERRALLPKSLVAGLKQPLSEVRHLHGVDLAVGWGAASLPHALISKYANANRQWGWQWLFPQRGRWQDSETGREGRYHLNPGLTKSPVEAGDQGACPSADPSSFVPSQDGPRSSAPFAGPQLDLEAALPLSGTCESAEIPVGERDSFHW
ncbi:MAG: hypothetical protein ACK6BC_03640 [Cyanobacteriota bacterium]